MTELTEMDETLASAMAALGNPLRVALLRELRSPRALSEIELRSAEGGRSKPLSRQAVREHLDRLVEMKVVQRRPSERSYGETQEYILNHQTLYAMAETLRATARIRAEEEPAMPTSPAHPTVQPVRPGTCLVVVKGLDEGATFDIAPPVSGTREWLVGRRRGLDVSLDYDPFVSSENARIRWDGSAHVASDLSGSTNGTSVNFRLLSSTEAVALAHGDVVGVGRTLLLYWRRPPSESVPSSTRSRASRS